MKRIILIALIFAFPGITARGQNDIKEQLKKIPFEAAAPEDFVPADWEIYTRADGDLKADGLKDYVIDILPKRDEESKTDDSDRVPYDAVVVLFADKSGRLRRERAER